MELKQMTDNPFTVLQAKVQESPMDDGKSITYLRLKYHPKNDSCNYFENEEICVRVREDGSIKDAFRIDDDQTYPTVPFEA